ncbi:hypothetical protein [Solirubrobacter soli]|uniref:hypothetical protein n=1 Tax=Solirubrobacter soli TaxID=363832 RepID=UPI0004222D10|nr:hypothetical protein [Solirubrobacter soli]
MASSKLASRIGNEMRRDAHLREPDLQQDTEHTLGDALQARRVVRLMRSASKRGRAASGWPPATATLSTAAA